METNKDGWQFWVEIGEKEVIKTPKTAEEAAINVKKHLEHIGKEGELDARVKKILKDIETSTEIIGNSKIPREMFANLEFLEEGKIKQSKAIVLGDKLNDLWEKGEVEEAKKLIDKSVNFLVDLWKYGIHELTFKFHSNFGILSEKIVLLDPFELTDKKEKVEKQINNRKWAEKYRHKSNPPEELFEYFNEVIDKKMTLENLKKTWGTKK